MAVDAAIAAHTQAETVASRKASQIALEAFTAALPELLGGSADLTGSNLTNTKSTPNLRVGANGEVLRNEAGGVIHRSEAQGLTEGWSRRVPSSVTTKPSFL